MQCRYAAQFLFEQLPVMLRLHFNEAGGTKAVHITRRHIIPLLLAEGYGAALAKQDGTYLAFKGILAAGAIFLFMLAHA